MGDAERERVLRLVRDDFELSRGHPLPMGATLLRGGVNFSVFSAHATAMTLVLYLPGDPEPVVEWPLDPRYNRTGDVWHVFVRGVDPGVEYAFRADMQPNPKPALHRFDPADALLDPYARGVSGAPTWGGDRPRPRRGRVVNDDFDWGLDQPLNTHLADSVIYEMHVRGFTAHPSSGCVHPGTYTGLVERIPYLRELGVTAVELMPVTEFEENAVTRRDPSTGARLKDFWGYQPLSFFAPKAGFGATGAQAGEVAEFKRMVKALHEAGIEVVLDMVFNHTGEGSSGSGPSLSWRGLDSATWYLLDHDGRDRDYTGCGNTLNCNHPAVRAAILDCLRYWVTEMHVDGFRFDLAAVLGRGRDGQALANPPLLESVAADPVLAHTKLIAEAWDAAGLYQVGSFPHSGRWAEWNGRFRDDVRRFMRGDPGMAGALATRLAGSADLYQHDGRAPYHSVNFVTSHDGFTLRDLVSYERKHNDANGEDGRDGQDENFAWNCGAEGETDSAEVRALRDRQVRNLLAILFLAQGVPMLLAGDEVGRTQGGNNNAYCQDNETSWLDWTLRETSADLLRFVRGLVHVRRGYAGLRRRSFGGPGERVWVKWQGPRRGTPDWSDDARFLGMHLTGGGPYEPLFAMFNGGPQPVLCELPSPSAGRRWRRLLDTSLPSPAELVEWGSEPPIGTAGTYLVAPHCVAALVAR